MPAAFPFVQFEFTHAIGPPPGRYMVRDPDADPVAESFVGDPSGTADVLVHQVRGAPAARGRLRRRDAAPADDGDVREVPLSVATAILSTQPLNGNGAVRSLMAGLEDSADRREAMTATGLGLVNQAIAAFRLASADPYVAEITRADPRRIRVGHGPADLLYAGKWEAAITVPDREGPRVPRAAQNMPTQAMSMILGGLARPLEGEELVLRAVLDLEQGRWRAAAVSLWAGVQLILGELDGERLEARVHRGLDDVITTRDALKKLAETANRRPLDIADAQRLGELAELVGAFVDLRRYDPLGY
ncbi:MAG: hypothetical protein QOF76_121 [Solirubrobacteraceae bacterium]|nr:hypothetical protein [Solirubrobacteraceae bacterium]